MKKESVKISQYDCLWLGPRQAEAIILCLHGYGANAEDLAPLAHFWEQAISLNTAYVFPNGPLTIDGMPPQHRAWFPIDAMALNMAIQLNQLELMRRQLSPALEQATSALTPLVEELLSQCSILGLAGFSQGSMLALNYFSCFDRDSLVALCLYSCFLVNPDSLKDRLKQHRNRINIFQSHGRYDPILPFSGALELKELLINCKFPVEFYEFEGQHEIPPDIIHRSSHYFQNAFAGRLES